MQYLAKGVAVAAFATAGSAALARDKSTPDWPCVQKKVENLSVSQVWDGPSIEGVKGWWENEQINALLPILTSRKIPKPEAEEAIKTFAESLPEDKRDQQLVLLFAGLFDTINTQRRAVINGLEKYLRSQRDRAEEIEKQGVALAELETKAATDEKAKDELQVAQEKYDWASRIFKERQDNIPIACEIPVIIDQRVFELGRAIRSHMKS